MESAMRAEKPRRVPRRRRLAGWAAAAAIALGASTIPAAAAATANDGPTGIAQAGSAAGGCSALDALELSDTVSVTAELVQSGSDVAGQMALPEFCRVALTVSQAINIEVWLPTETYNGRFQAVGNGGYAGNISYRAMATALRGGYATSSTDTGHVGTSLDGTFALNPDGTLNDQLIEDFASRSVIEMTLKAKELIGAFYGADAEYSYWNGCSTGGRQGLRLAQELPGAYDGIIAASPAISWDRLFNAALWGYVVQQNELGGLMSACKLKAFNDASIAHCDDYDGVVDGVLGDPNLCDFDPATLVGQDFGCGAITEAEAVAVRKLWEGPRTPEGEQLWFGQPHGLPLQTYASPPNSALQDHLAYWIKQDPSFDWRTLDYAGFEEAFRDAQASFGAVMGSDDPDLRPFRDAGGKIVMWAGQAEQTMPGQTPHYYERVVDVFRSATQVQRFMRLFMAPGVGHCGGGAGPNVFDSFGALVDWVEHGVAPDSILASRVSGGQVVRSQPLCPYPLVARYDGRGEVNDASSYDCRRNYGAASAPNGR